MGPTLAVDEYGVSNRDSKQATIHRPNVPEGPPGSDSPNLRETVRTGDDGSSEGYSEDEFEP